MSSIRTILEEVGFALVCEEPVTRYSRQGRRSFETVDVYVRGESFRLKYMQFRPSEQLIRSGQYDRSGRPLDQGAMQILSLLGPAQ